MAKDMIISRTPNRISFFGGGTDYPIWYENYGGEVLSATINKYSYITLRYLPQFFNYKFRVRYFRTEETNNIEEISHNSIRECAKFLKLNRGFELVHNADLPARSGLGSSSAFTVGMLNAVHALQTYMPTKRELALNAITIEQKIIGESVGSQDQVSAAWGGFNLIKFSKQNTFEVNPLILSSELKEELEKKLLLMFTGFPRNASKIAEKQIKLTPSRFRELTEMRSLTKDALILLTTDLDKFGKLLNEQWKLKRSLSDKISNVELDDIYQTGLKNGALGGKILGAGGGGFMLFYAPESKHNKIKSAFAKKLFVPFRFENAGSQIIYYTHE